MSKTVSCKPIHATVLPLILCILLTSTAALAAEKSLKLYSPFDEPKPPIPREMLSDTRLDQKVEVFVKGKNLKEILDELSAKTGVKLVVERETRFERPIIYFHSRPLRDVLTEVSGLYGYHWLAKGEKGAYRYELFESIKHAQRRKLLVQERKETLDSLLLDFTREFLNASPDDEQMKQLAQANPEAYKELTDPEGKRLPALIDALGEDFRAQALADVSTEYAFPQLPAQMQTDICAWINDVYDAGLAGGDWDETNKPPACSSSSFASARVVMKRITGGGEYGLPRFQFDLVTPQPCTYGSQWPAYGLKLEDYCSVAGWDIPRRVISVVPIPDDPKITTRLRLDAPYVSFGDALEAIARQSGRDLIADYYFNEKTQKSVSEMPLRQFVEKLCTELRYTCQVDGSLLRLRFDDWYLLPLMEEPPADLLARCWHSIETTGALQFDDFVGIANLNDRQRKWPGLRLIQGVAYPLRMPSTVRLWGSLTNAQKIMVESADGLPASQLSESQMASLGGWAVDDRANATPDDLAGALLRIKATTGTRRSAKGPTEEFRYEEFTATIPNVKVISESVVPPFPFGPDELKALIEQRRADREADVIELLD